MTYFNILLSFYLSLLLTLIHNLSIPAALFLHMFLLFPFVQCIPNIEFIVLNGKCNSIYTHYNIY